MGPRYLGNRVCAGFFLYEPAGKRQATFLSQERYKKIKLFFSNVLKKRPSMEMPLPMWYKREKRRSPLAYSGRK
jgi:hypothetical protein